MISKKRIFSNLCLLAAFTIAIGATAATTKVGNGDDGGDLEGATPVTSGILFETRMMALANLRALNVQGIAGLGQLIPEMQYSELLLAKSDVGALSSEGTWEISEDRKKVYARTFPESHAPTRFFPAALHLTHDQLVALHKHEALHRALPAESRENEETVAILTMAITSPSANFDRVNMIARSELGRPQSQDSAVVTSSTATSSTAMSAPPIVLPAPQNNQIYLEQGAWGLQKGRRLFTSIQRLGVTFSKGYF